MECLSLVFLLLTPLKVAAVDKRDIWQKPNKVLSALNLNKKDDVFCEIGAGDGYFSLKASKYVKEVIATDIDEQSLKKLSAEANRIGIDNIQTASAYI